MSTEKRDLFSTLSEKDRLLLIMKSATLKVKYDNACINRDINSEKKYTLTNKPKM